MKKSRLFALIVFSASFFLFSTIALAATSASIVYQETSIGNGKWQYDYSIFNTSDNGEYLYSAILGFEHPVTTIGSNLPAGWNGTVWEGAYLTSYVDAMSINSNFDINAGSSLDGFSFIADYQLGDVKFTAEFDNHAGQLYNSTGTTAQFNNPPVAPEPLSSSLFLIGGSVFGLRRFWKK